MNAEGEDRNHEVPPPNSSLEAFLDGDADVEHDWNLTDIPHFVGLHIRTLL